MLPPSACARDIPRPMLQTPNLLIMTDFRVIGFLRPLFHFGRAPLPAVLPLLLLAVLALGVPLGCAAAPDLPPGVQLETYDVSPYARVLTASVDRGMVDYAAITDLPETYDDLDGQLSRYLDVVARYGPESTPELFPTEDDEIAYYLNAYNAIMIRLWLDNGGRTADADDGVSWLTWFTLNQWKIDQRTMSLDYLEQRLMRVRYDEPRIHAALVCGAIDCPPLRDEPYVGGRLDAQLDDQMHAWLTDPSDDGLQVDDEGNVRLSRIFSWYRDDFRPTGGLQAMLERHLDDDDPRKAAAVRAAANNRLDFKGYDWTINLPVNAGPQE